MEVGTAGERGGGEGEVVGQEEGAREKEGWEQSRTGEATGTGDGERGLGDGEGRKGKEKARRAGENGYTGRRLAPRLAAGG